MPGIPEPQIIRSHRQSVVLQITSNGELVVKAPVSMPLRIVHEFIQDKSDWISETLAKVRRRQAPKKKDTGEETMLYLGKYHTVKITDGIAIEIRGDDLLFPNALLFRKEKELLNWYIRQARELITKRVQFHAERMNASYISIMFSDTKSKWGTCGPNNELQFNWRLIMAPLMVLNYVVIHELAHTKEKNHGRSFWNLVRFQTPAYRQHRNWLNANAHLLTL